MGGHGGLNILPQKRWNVYNWDNRERVRRDEQEAARQQQEQREQEHSGQREARLSELRRRRNGVAGETEAQAHEPVAEGAEPEEEKGQAEDASASINQVQAEDASASINQHNIEALFDNAPMGLASGKRRRLQPPEEPKKAKKKTLKEQQEQAGDDDRYRLAYSREGSKQPWYVVARSAPGSPPRVERRRQGNHVPGEPRKKSIEELRAERLEREEKERRRARGLITGPPVKRRYNSSYL